MSNTRKAIQRGTPTEREAERYIKYSVKMNDKDFDSWLLFIVRKRADNGSERAREMLDTLEDSHSDTPV